jgi:hypothetical protein
MVATPNFPTALKEESTMTGNMTGAEFTAAADKSLGVDVAGVIPAKDGFSLLHFYGTDEASGSEPIIAWAVMQDHSVRPVTTQTIWDLELMPHLAVREPTGVVKGAVNAWSSEADWHSDMLARYEETALASAA